MADQKKQLTLDTDWQTAILALFGIVFAAFLGIGSILFILAGKISISQEASWHTVIGVVALITGLIAFPERRVRFAIGLMLFQPVIEIIGWAFRFSPGAQAMDQLIGRCATAVAWLIICLDGIQWFKEHTTYT